MSESIESRKIGDLKVPDLRSELEKRDLDKTGVKAILLERLYKALLEEGEDPLNYIFDKIEIKNINYTEKSTEKTCKSPSVEKKLSPVVEKSPTTPVKTIPKYFIKKPGPKSKTMHLAFKSEKLIVQKKNNETEHEQANSSNVIISSEYTKNLTQDTNYSDVPDSNEAKAKKIDAIDSKESNVVPCYENSSFLKNEASCEEKAQALENDKTGIVLLNDTNNENEKFTKLPPNCLLGLSVNNNKEVKDNCVENVGNLSEKQNTIGKNVIVRIKKNEIKPKVKLEPLDDEDNIQDEELDHEVDEEEIKGINDDFNQTDEPEKSNLENTKDDNNEDSINLTIGEDDIKLFADEEDTNIEKEDEVIENHTKEEISLNKQRESHHPVTANSSRVTPGSIKSRRSATEKRIPVVEKPRSSHKEDKDNSNAKPFVSVPKDEKKEEEKQIKDKVEAGNKQSNDTKAPQVSNDTTKKNNTLLVRNIWVSGLSSITKATDLKQLFSKYGKVVGAKVVTNAKTPGARCYGFVTLSSAEDANRSIENLHKTELHGRVISVERAKRDNGYQQTVKNSDASKVNENLETDKKNKITDEKKDKREDKREKRPEITINDDKKLEVSKDRKRSLSKDKSHEIKRTKIVIERDDRRRDIKSKSSERDREKLRDLERERERLEREKRRQQEIYNFTKMKTERERQKQKEQEKAMKEEERKRRIEKERQLEIERKQKEEAIRLEKERQKLRIERERIEKEKAELLRLERENQRLERERLQREKEELRRAQEKLEETKRQALLKRAMPPSPPLSGKRHSSSNSSRYEERKEPIRSSRVQANTDYINQAAPPPPNITSSRHRYEQHSSDSRRSRPSPPPPPPPASRPKDSTVSMRYGGPQTTDHHYRSRDDRPDRREESRRKESSSGNSSRHVHSSYDSSKSSYGMSRNSENNAWSSNPVKSSYNSLGSNSGSSGIVMSSRPDPWTNSNSSREIETAVWQRPPQPPADNRWNSASSNQSSMSMSGRSSSNNPLYVNNHQVLPNIGLNMSSSYNDNRFDSYKMSGMSRKY